MIRTKSYFMAAVAALALVSPAAASTTLNWSFTSDDGLSTGGGLMTLNAKNVVTGFRGTFKGQKVKFYPIGAKSAGFNPNDPSKGFNTLHGVPNTGGADYIFDDVYTPGVGVDVYGLLISVGQAPNFDVFYDISLDSAGASETDFFSIGYDGHYIFDDGVFTTTPLTAPQIAALAANHPFAPSVPEPAGWTMMIMGFAGLGAALRSRRSAAAAQA